MHSLGSYQRDLHDCNIDRIALLVMEKKKKKKKAVEPLGHAGFLSTPSCSGDFKRTYVSDKDG